MNGSVLIYSVHQDEPEHERACHIELGRRLSLMLGRRFGGYYDSTTHNSDDDVYLLATDTIVGTHTANKLGIHDESRLFGGVAPHAFVPTKAITHPLFEVAAIAPAGWSHEFGEHTRHVVLAGYTVFAHADALRAGDALLNRGPVRLKPVQGKAGRGQRVVSDPKALREALAQLDSDQIVERGLVLEEQLEQVNTYSVGQVRVAGHVASYVGTQHLTTDNTGERVYGGSALIVTRGDYSNLLALSLDTAMPLAVAQAQLYDRAAEVSYPDFFSSRRNYDVACGIDSQGRWRYGVLEQSWRPGGASAAEILALETFHARPDIDTVKAATVELFGSNEKAPSNAIELFNGEDREIGPIRKYVMLERYGNSQHRN